MIDPSSIAVGKELWAVPDGPSLAGAGTKTIPFRLGGNLDLLVPMFGPSVRLHLAPGLYRTRGFKLPATFIGGDDGVRDVTIILADNAVPGQSVLRMFADANWNRYFCISGWALDRNWSNQAGSQTGNFKIELIGVQTVIGRVAGCEWRNWGCAAGDYPADRKLECFAAWMSSFSSGDLALYDRQYDTLKLTEPSPTRLEFLANVIDPGTWTGGGYGDGLFVQTSQSAALGDRQPFGTRTTQAALIRGNRASVPGGIAFGAVGLHGGGVEQTEFSENDATDSKCALNIDTGRLSKVTIRNNRWMNVAQGPNVTPDGNGDALDVSGNVTLFSKPFGQEAQWGIRTLRTSNQSSNRNLFILPSEFQGTLFDGITPGIGNLTQPLIDGGTNQGEIDGALARAVTAETALASESQRSAVRRAAMDTAIAGLQHSI